MVRHGTMAVDMSGGFGFRGWPRAARWATYVAAGLVVLLVALGLTAVHVVREPFPSKASATSLVFGRVGEDAPLRIRSRMPDSGVIFSDGIEADFLRFTAGMEATITLARSEGRLAF